MSDKQRTIATVMTIQGIGLHSGKPVRVTFRPAQENEGVVFVRTDLPQAPRISASMGYLIERPRRTSVGMDGVEVHTIEHVMAALVGAGIDNIIIELTAEELPGLDGSALPFWEILKQAGMQEQSAPRRYFQPREPLYIEDGDSSLMILPDPQFRISYTMSYPNVLLKAQYASFVFTPEVFEKSLAPSRTFCLQVEADSLQEQGLGKGANYENTVVVGKNGEVVQNTLRFPDEFVRHKICDLIGDLYLLGQPIRGHVIGIKSGHPLNIRLLQKIKQLQERNKAGVGVVDPGFVLKQPMDVVEIQKILPHRYPFLLVDRIVELQEDTYAVGIKNVTVNEEFFNGHFPGKPVMPGVLIVEAMAQVAGVLILSKRTNLGKRAYFMSIDRVKFRRMVLPGDQLRLEVRVMKLKSKTGQVCGRAFVDAKLVCEAELMFSLGE